MKELLILGNEAIREAFLSRYCVEFLKVELPELFNIDRAAILRAQNP